MIAEGFLHQGATVYISARKGGALEETAKELSAIGPCVAITSNASGADGAKAMADAYLKHESSLDILVNNAGAAWGADFDEFPESGWDKVMDLNLKTPFFLAQALHGALKAAGSKERLSKVINIASIDGISVNMQETYSYAASKSGLIHLTKRMAMRLIRDNIAGDGDRAGRLRLRHEPRCTRQWRRGEPRHPGAPDRHDGGHGGGGDLPRIARGRLCGRLDADRRRRRKLFARLIRCARSSRIR